jgi:hypothetical protein
MCTDDRVGEGRARHQNWSDSLIHNNFLQLRLQCLLPTNCVYSARYLLTTVFTVPATYWLCLLCLLPTDCIYGSCTNHVKIYSACY